MEAQLVSLGYALTVVIALVVLLAMVYRRFRLEPTSDNNQVRIRSVRSLGTREKLVLVALDGEELLLGVTTSQITFLYKRGTNTRELPQS